MNWGRKKDSLLVPVPSLPRPMVGTIRRPGRFLKATVGEQPELKPPAVV